MLRRAENMFYRQSPLLVFFLSPPTLAAFCWAAGTATQPCVTFNKLAASAQHSRRQVPWFTCRGTPGACGEDQPKINRFLFPIKGQKTTHHYLLFFFFSFFGPNCPLASASCLLVMADTAVGAQSSFWCQEPAGATRGLNLSPSSLESDMNHSRLPFVTHVPTSQGWQQEAAGWLRAEHTQTANTPPWLHLQV